MAFGTDDKVCHAHLVLIEVLMAKHRQQYTQAAPIDTSVSFSSHADRSTPRAQTQYDYDEDMKRRSARMSANLAGKCLDPASISLG
jgi:hypothetical protein